MKLVIKTTIAISLVLVVFYLFSAAILALADNAYSAPSHASTAGCVQYARSTMSSRNGGSHTSALRYGTGCNVTVKTHKSNDTVSPVAPVIVPTQPTVIVPTSTPVTPIVITTPESPVVTDEPTQTPVVPVVIVEPKVKCNNGEGNGAEGCSPAKSSNANNDENNTTPKEDKSNK